MFLYDALLEAIICGNTEIPTDKYQTELQNLRSSSGLQSQFDVLTQVSPDPDEEEEALDRNLSNRFIPGNYNEGFDTCTWNKIL